MMIPKSLARWMLLGGMTVVAAGWLALFFFPLRREMNDLAGQWHMQTEYIEDSEPLVEQIEKLERKVGATKRYCAQWRSSAPTDRSISAFYGKVLDGAKGSGVVVARFEPQAAQPMESIRRWPLRTTLVGRYEQLASLLASFEAMPATIWFDECKIWPAQEDGKTVQLETTLLIFADKEETSD
jgi:Tfp pilus assembly protein PilO